MSRTPIDPRVQITIVVGTLSALLACAPAGSRNTTPESGLYPSDTSSIGNTDGKTIETLFASRFPGVTVTPTDGGGLQIRIRGGSNSFYGSDEPLVVLDGTPIPAGSRGIVFLNPHDIATIEVLKNPADIAIYGMQGGNGVVKITTKRPGRR